MLGEPTNADRAEWAREALTAFEPNVYFGKPDDVEHITTRISDLVINLLHLARREWDERATEEFGQPFEAAEFAARAARIHDEEVEEAQEDV